MEGIYALRIHLSCLSGGAIEVANFNCISAFLLKEKDDFCKSTEKRDCSKKNMSLYGKVDF